MLHQRGHSRTLVIYPFLQSPLEIRPGSSRLTADPETGEIKVESVVLDGSERVDTFLQAVAVCRDYIERSRS
jgi:hypothetical protein